MSKLRVPMLIGLALITTAARSLAAPDGLEIRFYPDRIYAFEAEVRRGISTLVLQNAAIVNRGRAAVELTGGKLEVLAGDEVVQSVPLSQAALEALAVRSGRLAASGMLQMAAFQFSPDTLVANAKVVGSRVLGPNEGLLLGSRAFLTQGAPVDRLRMSIEGRASDGAAQSVVAELPVRSGGTKGSYSFPLSGLWWVPVGPTLHTPHRWAVPEEFALDIVRLEGGGSTHHGDGTHLSDYAAWDADVHAAADGVVVAAVDRFADSADFLRRKGESDESFLQRVLRQQSELIAKGEDAVIGNHLVIAHPDGEFSVYAHLRSGSLAVKLGDSVRRGQIVARLGSSGNSTEPHLHFQISDGPSPLRAAGIPIRFDGIRILGADWERQIQSGDLIDAP